MNIILFLIAWWIIGFYGFVWWETSKYNVKESDIWFGCFMAIFGPLTWLMGYLIYGEYKTKKDEIVFKKRK